GRGGVVAPPRRRFQTLQADRLQRAVDLAVKFLRRYERLRRQRFSLKGRTAGQALVQDQPQAVDVSPRSGRSLPAQLLGSSTPRFAIGPTRLAEAGDVRLPEIVQKDDAGLKVPMYHAALVSVMHCPGDLGKQASRRPEVLRQPRQMDRKRASFNRAPAEVGP